MSLVPYPYTAELQDDGKYLVQFLDFPNGFTEGDTVEEAAANAADVLSLLVAVYADEGKELPIPSPIGSHPYSVVDFRIIGQGKVK